MKALADLRSLLPPALLDGEGWDRLLARVSGLPNEALEFCGFEFRLHSAEPVADMFVAALPDSSVSQHFIRAGEAPSAQAPAVALARHLRELADADSALRQDVELTGLEYDVAETPAGQHPPPGVFLQLRLADAAPNDEPREPRKPQKLPIGALANAVGWEDDAAERHAIDRALAALPSGCVVSFLGAMPGRSPRGIRLIVEWIGYDEVAATLERLGWRGAALAAQTLLAELRPTLPAFRLAVDVAAQGVSPRIGFELFSRAWKDPLESWLVTTRNDWRPVVEELARRGWCVPEKARGLLEWCSQERIYGEDGMFLLHKGINHMKLTITAGAGEENATVKAYGGLLFSRVQ